MDGIKSRIYKLGMRFALPPSAIAMQRYEMAKIQVVNEWIYELGRTESSFACTIHEPRAVPKGQAL